MNILDWFKKYEKPKNSGVLLAPLSPEDYVVGANSPIEYKERLKTGDWTSYMWDNEVQWCSNNGSYVDSMSCVSQSVINCIEAQEFFITGKKVNYSKRWLAKMSGTTAQGNYLNKVADTIRQYGLVLEEDYPTPASYTFNEYYQEINAVKLKELMDKGKEWLKKWTFEYEFLAVNDPNIDYHLKHCPLQVVIPGHAVAGMYSPDQFTQFKDSYDPFDKKYLSSQFQAVMKPILKPKSIEAKLFGFKDSPELWFSIPLDSMQRLEYIKANLTTWLPDYSLNEEIIKLPIKKP